MNLRYKAGQRAGMVIPISLLFYLLMRLLFAGQALAGGLYLEEFGTPSMGVASAGAESVAVDASTSWHNPAGMTRIQGSELMLTGGLAYSRVKFDQDANNVVNGGNGGDAGGAVPVGGGFFLHSLSEDLKFGFNLYSISGALLDYNDDWVGRYQVEEVSIFTITFNPTIAYRVNDWLSLGAGVLTIFGKLELDVAAPPPVGTGKVEIDGDDWQLGFNAGTLFELSEQTRLGLTYFSGVDFDLGGDVKVTGGGLTLANVGVNTDLPLPQMVRAGVYHDINSRWALLGTIAWEEWSELDTVNISTGTNGAALPKNWDDVWHFAVGLHYRPSTQWLLQGGLAYDTSPVDAEDRTADMPIDEQIRYALGAQYAWSEKLSIGAQFEYIDMGNAEIKGPLLNGDYKTNDLFIFGFNLNWKL